MGFGFGVAGRRAVFRDQGAAGNAIESVLVAAAASLAETVAGAFEEKSGE
jgi:hypothetical protein